MKQRKTFRRLMSYLLIATMLLSMAVVGLVGVSAAETAELSYSFKYKNAGFAEGSVTLTAASSADYGKYYFFWADDTKALDGYAEITSLNLSSDSSSFTFREHTAIPAGATKLIAIKSTSVPSVKTVASATAVYDIPESKQFKYADSEKEYNFQTLSDIHFHKDNYSAYAYAEAHFTSALNAAAQRGAEFVSTCGDNTNYCDQKEWGMYLNTIANSDFTGPVYEVNGNHEPYGKDEIPSANQTNLLNQYKIATGLDTVTDKMRSELYYEITAPNGDHHIYMALELVNNKYHPGISDNFTKAQIDWLEGLLNKYKNDGKKIFIYEHAPFSRYGAGDNKTNPHYEAAMTIDENLYPQTYRFKELLEANKNIVWFSGHTHIDFKYNYNIDNENGTTAYTVHVPSTASTTTVNSSNGLDYVGKADSAQGYFVDVYADATVINGTDLVKNQILPLYTYMVDYSGEKLVENDGYVEEETDPTPGTDPVDPPYTGETVKIYFTNNKSWSGAYVYGFYGEVGGTATGEPLGAYPGTKMTYVGKNDMNQDVYSCDIPADIDYIKFVDGSATNNRTDNIANAEFEDGTGFYLQDKGAKYWPYATYTFAGVTETADVAAVGAGTTVYAINSTKWATVCAHYWGGGVETSWPGESMVKTGETVNGFDVYSITLDTAPENIIFNNNNNGAQTSDLTFQAGKVYDIKAGTWYDSLSDVPGTDPLGTDRFLVGSFNGWITTANEFKLKNAGDKVAYVEMDLDAHTTYEFKIVREGTWTSCKETLQITETGTGFTFSSSISDNTKITTRDAGTYVFAFGLETSQLAVTYPTADPVVTDPVVTDPVVTTPAVTDPVETEPVVTTPATTAPAVETIKVYFTNNRGWSGAYIYGFYGKVGEASTGEPLGAYPGTEMTFVEVNEMGQDIYVAEIPADIDYIKFCDGDSKGTNNRTDNIANAEFENNTGFYLDDKGSKYWPYATYTYEPSTPETSTAAPVVTTVPAETTAPAVTTVPAVTTAPAETTAPVVTTAPVATTTAPAETTAPQPTETEATEPKATETEPKATETKATEPAIVLLYGDADQSNAVNVKDATAIQKHVAGLIKLSEYGFMVADVDVSEVVNVKDATMIQKLIAGIIKEFPSGSELVIGGTETTDPEPTTTVTEPTESKPEETKPVETKPTESKPEETKPVETKPTEPKPEDPALSELLQSVKTTLENEPYYASYVAYADLKKVYYEYKDANVAESELAAAIAEINAALDAYNTMKKNNPNHIPAYKAPTPGSYVVHGDLTGTGSWIDYSFEPSATNKNIGSFTIDLAPGTYKFVIHEDGTDNWYKNGGTINDTCNNWIFATSGADTTLVASGGTYTFQFSISNKALTVTKK